MRIIAGKCKGRKLDAPPTDMRPTLDRTKETLFNILQLKVPDAAVRDLFAGSGSLGLEAFSRGAAKVVFVDVDRRAAETVKSNCKKVGCEAVVLTAHFESALAQLKEKFDLIFIDPPYKLNFYYRALKTLCDFDRLNDGAVAVCEHSSEDKLPEKVGGFLKYREKKMGKCQFSFYRFESGLQSPTEDGEQRDRED